MKIVFINIFICSIIFSYSQTYNLGLSFRPLNTFVTSDKTISLSDTTKMIIKTDNFDIKTNVLFEIENKKKFFHLLFFGIIINKRNNKQESYQNNLLTSLDYKEGISTSYLLGYGFGKNFMLHKKGVFLKLQNSLHFKIQLQNENSNIQFYNNNNFLYKENISNSKNTPIYTLEYEIKPIINYKINFFSIGIGFPVGVQFNTFSGDNIINSRTIDYNNDSEIVKDYIISGKSSYLYFKYDIELMVFFNLNFKKK